MGIRENVEKLRSELPDGVELVLAVKFRTANEILEAIAAGVTTIGVNHVQEAEKLHEAIGNRVEWHLIGHLQRNKAKKAVEIFDMIETADSIRIATEIDKWCGKSNKVMPVQIEINSGREAQKTGVFPEQAQQLVRDMLHLENIRITGLMTMGPQGGTPEDARPFFAETRRVFDEIANLDLPGVRMLYLSMGMTNSYQVALEEGANIVRLGTKIFGERRGLR
jgi:pyridoxal phosphate enzyme (YggS family)